MEKQKKVREINDAWADDLKGDSEEGFYMYEPFAFKREDGSEYVPYWEENRKIVFCNLNTPATSEDLGISEDQYHTFTWEHYQKGMGGAAKTLYKTALFCYCLQKKLEGAEIKAGDLSAPGLPDLENAMRKVCYMNLARYVGSKSWTKPDKNSKDPKSACYWTWDFYNQPANRKSQRELITALEPDIFITTGISDNYQEGKWAGGLDFFNYIYKTDEPDSTKRLELDKEGLQWFETDAGNNPKHKTLFASIQHPSQQNTRFDNQYIVVTVERIYNAFKGGS